MNWSRMTLIYLMTEFLCAIFIILMTILIKKKYAKIIDITETKIAFLHFLFLDTVLIVTIEILRNFEKSADSIKILVNFHPFSIFTGHLFLCSDNGYFRGEKENGAAYGHLSKCAQTVASDR